MSPLTHAQDYLWLAEFDSSNTIEKRISLPENFTRVATETGHFSAWLRNLPLHEGNPPVVLYSGRQKAKQDLHYAVINIDIGIRDLQQCADAIIRLRAEYLYATGNHNNIHFNFTSGERIDFKFWAQGYRPLVKEDNVRWMKSGKRDQSYDELKRYLTHIFMYAGTASLSFELDPIGDPTEIEIGDVFIEGGFPGHAVLVVDVAENNSTGEKIFLLAQSYTPAQSVHILINENNADLSPWYSVDFGDTLATPLWTFSSSHLKRFLVEE